MFKNKEKKQDADYKELEEQLKAQQGSEGNRSELTKELERFKDQNREVERQNLVLKKQVSYLSKGASN